MEKRSLYTQRVKSGKITYFFDLKQTQKEKGYMVITQSQQGEDQQYERQRIVIFEEDLERFGQAMITAMINFRKRDQASIVAEARQTYSRAYETWSKEEDLKLEVLLGDDVPVAEIAAILERQPGAIRSRIRKLGLVRDEAAAEIVEA
ncbi:MAG: DUF3276 family protein [Bacteroidota bacterium]